MEFDVFLNCAAEEEPTAANPRRFSWGIANNGYGPIVQRILRVAEGRRVLFHNPFGRSPDREMEWDQQLNCENAGKGHVVKSFAREVVKLIGVAREIIVYLGAPHNTPRMTKALAKPDGLDNWFWNWWRSLRMPLDLGLSVAIDNASSVDTDWEAYLFRSLGNLLRTRGGELYIEATPPRTSRMCDQAPAIIRDDKFNGRHVPPQHPGKDDDFPAIGERDWYRQPVYVLIYPKQYPVNEPDALVQRMLELSSYKVHPMLALPLAERLV